MSLKKNFDFNNSWSIEKASKYFGLKYWGKDHFKISNEGFLEVHPSIQKRTINKSTLKQGIRLTDVIQEAKAKGLSLPLTIRIQDLLKANVQKLNENFKSAIKEENYTGKFKGVFPIKVNQMREVLEEVLSAGESYDYGLECGSKPELMIALAYHKNPQSLIICNGYKDEDFIRLALQGLLLGKSIFLVIEQFSELAHIIKLSKSMGVVPNIGVRVKLAATGEGIWSRSSGEEAKFGLTSPEIYETSRILKQEGFQQSLQLVHFHIGSQVTNIQTIKKATVEATRYYCELDLLGFPMRFIDVGGGLGVDYDGSRSNFESSMNYTLEEYARDIVHNVKSVCNEASVSCPNIITESGRAVAASHSILVTEVYDKISKSSIEPKISSKKYEPVLESLIRIYNEGFRGNLLECYHGAVQKKEEADNLFNLGYLKLSDKSLADSIFWKICHKLVLAHSDKKNIPEEFEELREIMASQYICNFSIFQSLIDHWACGQLFPITPLQRLNEKPTVDTTLVDITCDSEGRVGSFVDIEDRRNTLRLHELVENEPYYIGIFYVGAYQDIMGDLHNLFGRVNEVHVFHSEEEENGFYIEDRISGFSVNDVLNLTQYDGKLLSRKIKKQIDQAIEHKIIKPRVGIKILDEYTELLKSHTYLSN